MTDSEILMLAMGTNLGVLLTLAVHFVGQAVDGRRDARADQATLNQARKSIATSDWRDALTVRVKA